MISILLWSSLFIPHASAGSDCPGRLEPARAAVARGEPRVMRVRFDAAGGLLIDGESEPLAWDTSNDHLRRKLLMRFGSSSRSVEFEVRARLESDGPGSARLIISGAEF